MADFLFENEQAVVTGNFEFGLSTLQPAFNPNLVTLPISCTWGVGDSVSLIHTFIRQSTFNELDSVFKGLWRESNVIDTTFKLVHDDSLINTDVVTSVITNTGNLTPLDTPFKIVGAELSPIDKTFTTFRQKVFEQLDSANLQDWSKALVRDNAFNSIHRSVNLYGDRGSRPDYRYFPHLTNFTFKGEQANVTSNFVDPIRFDTQRVRLVPVDVSNTVDSGKKQRKVDFSQKLFWGYSVNNFVIGGSTLIGNDGNDTRPPIPDIETVIHPDYEVFRIVNIVNIVTLPDRENIDFSDFTISLDRDSFSWVANFNIVGTQSYEALKPNGRNLVQLEVSINDVVFSLFVADVSRSRSQGKTGYGATAYSSLKLLSFPYAPKRSFTQSSVRTAAQLVTDELNGTGLTLNWQSPSWSVAANIHSYQDKTAMGAILDVVNSIGSVVQPSPNGTTVTVRPKFPTSPWKWNDVTPEHAISISQFIKVSESNIPKDNPNKVFVFGETNAGIGADVTRLGTGGDKSTPDVVNKYITANDAAIERGRVELAENSYLNEVNMTTYVDTSTGLFYPLDLIEFTETDGTKWRGMVASLSIACQRNGTALLQQIKVLRYYE